MKHKRALLIKFGMLGINIMAILFTAILVYITTGKICDYFIAREFIGLVDKLPRQPHMLVWLSVLLLILLVLSFIAREFVYPENLKIGYGTLVFDFVISMVLVILLNFNYNGILCWVFANVISHIREAKGRYLFMFLAIISFIGTDFGLVSINYSMYSIQDYIQYYDATMQQYLLGVYNVLTSINMMMFIVFCIYVIQEQRGTIAEVNFLYKKLTDTNEELQDANTQLQQYADIKEKMGETKERNRLAREIHDTLGHTLTGISAGIDACIATIDYTPDSTKDRLKTIGEVTREGIREIRRSVTQLRPDALERLSLKEAIIKMVQDVNGVSGTLVMFDCQVLHLKFDEDEENTIYRIIQESVTNAIRHGKAGRVWITIMREYSDIHLSIVDDGIGCITLNPGFGTTHIIERIEMLKGTVAFDGSNGFATKVVIPVRWGEDYD